LLKGDIKPSFGKGGQGGFFLAGGGTNFWFMKVKENPAHSPYAEQMPFREVGVAKIPQKACVLGWDFFLPLTRGGIVLRWNVN
jgi:hypothetical protein